MTRDDVGALRDHLEALIPVVVEDVEAAVEAAGEEWVRWQKGFVQGYAAAAEVLMDWLEDWLTQTCA